MSQGLGIREGRSIQPMEAILSPKALNLITEALTPIIQANRQIERIKMVVSPESKIAQCTIVKTDYGILRIEKNNYVTPGVSYLIEEISEGSAFAWISRKE